MGQVPDVPDLPTRTKPGPGRDSIGRSRPARYNRTVNAVASARLDRSVFEIVTLDEDRSDREYWLAKSPAERMEALELMRQIVYGYDPATTRLQRVLEVAELK